MYSRGKVRRLVLFFMGLFATTIVASSSPGLGLRNSPPNSARCRSNLQKLTLVDQINLANRFARFEFLPLEDDSGFTLRLKSTEISEGVRTIDLPMDPNDHDFLSKFTWRSIWRIGRNKYELINTGLKSLQEYSNRVNEIVLDHVLNHPHENLVLAYSFGRGYIGQHLFIHRWALHQAVINIYKARKEYLSPRDLAVLEELNRYSENNDVFALLRSDGTQQASFLDLSPRDLTARLLITAQITYFGDRDFLTPSLRHMLLASNTPIYEKNDMLPFEYRIPANLLEEFRAAFYRRFEAKKTAEILRYAVFDPKLPEAAKDSFVLNLFRTAKARGMKHIVISVDRSTGRRFRRYGFQRYGILPTGSGKEFLYFLDIDSPQFRDIVSRLSDREKAISSSVEPIQ